MQGVQVSGFLSRGTGGMKGTQISGVVSTSRKHSKGTQISGGANNIGAGFQGLQIAGAVNRVEAELKGTQISGLINLAGGETHGLQLAPINYTRNLKGVQFGIINVADSSSGYSIGLINIIKRGTSNISVYSNELVPLNVALKMGNQKFYSILLAGSTIGNSNKAYTFGFGVGKAFSLGKKLGLITELTSQNVYLGSWQNMPGIVRLQTGINVRLSDRFTLSAGPAFSVYYSDNQEKKPGFRSFPLKDYPSLEMGKHVSNWFGWQGGISWRYGKN
jgi:hypothetical protein